MSLEGNIGPDKYENIKRCLRTKNDNAHRLVAEILVGNNSKEFALFCKFLIIFVSQYVCVLEPNAITHVHHGIMIMTSVADPNKLVVQEAVENVIEHILSLASEKIQHMEHQDHDLVDHLQYGCEDHVNCIQVMKHAMCTKSFSLLTTMCNMLKQKNADKAIQVIRYILSHKSLIVQRIQYPDIARLKASERQHILWYCWKALLYCKENRPAEKYIRYLLTMYVMTYNQKKYMDSMNLLFHACRIACMEKKWFVECSQGTSNKNAAMYKDVMSQSRSSPPPSSHGVAASPSSSNPAHPNSFSSALMFVPVYKSSS